MGSNPRPRDQFGRFVAKTKAWLEWGHWQTALAFLVAVAIGVVITAVAILGSAHIAFWKALLIMGLVFLVPSLPVFLWIVFNATHPTARTLRNVLSPASGVLTVVFALWCTLVLILPAEGNIAQSPNPFVTPEPTKFVGHIAGIGGITSATDKRLQQRFGISTVCIAVLWIENEGGPGRFEQWSSSATTRVGKTDETIGGSFVPPPLAPDYKDLPVWYPKGFEGAIRYSTATAINYVNPEKVYNKGDEVQGPAVIYFPGVVKLDTLRIGLQDQNRNWSWFTKASPAPLR